MDPTIFVVSALVPYLVALGAMLAVIVLPFLAALSKSCPPSLRLVIFLLACVTVLTLIVLRR